MKWVGIAFLVACGSSTKPAPAPPPPPAPAPPPPPPTSSVDCAALVAHLDQLMGSSSTPAEANKGIADCKQRIAANPDDPLMHCVAGTTTAEDMLSCVQLAKSPLAGKLVTDCAAMNDHVMAFFEDKNFKLTPQQRQEAIDGCIATYAGQPDHPSLQCAIHADTMNAALACVKDAPARRRVKHPEPEKQFARLARLAHAAHDRAGAFPKGSAPLLPEVSCCKTKSLKCEPTPTWKTDPVWTALGFSIDEPNLFQYAYTSDGTTFHAEAVGDLDCDGIFITWKLDGDASGEHVTQPLPNSD